MPEIQVSNDFARLELNTDSDVTDTNDSSGSFLGGVSLWWIYLSVFLIGFRKTRIKL